MIWLIAAVVGFVLIWVLAIDDPNLARPCASCGGQMRHLPGQDSGSTGEAKFGCTSCDYQEFRGGWGSETAYEKRGRAYDVYGRPTK